MSSHGSDSGSGSDVDMKSSLSKKTMKKVKKNLSEEMLKATSNSESDNIEVKPMKTTKKLQKTPSEEMLKNEPKKITTKDMIHQALIELKSRKGVSLYAIKKYMVDKYNVDTDKINYYIKKNIKSGVENGTILQTKGVGASGSFKLAPVKPEKKKAKKPKMEKLKTMEKTEKSKMIKTDSTEKSMEKKSMKKVEPKLKMQKKEKSTKKEENVPKMKKAEKEMKIKKAGKEPKESKNPKMATKEAMTPAKKRIVMMKKRKSVGSIIKPPKMKPKARE